MGRPHQGCGDYTPVIPALRRQRQEVRKFKASLDYIENPVSKTKQNPKQIKKEQDVLFGNSFK
jgi:hypothetical protein